MDGVLQSLENIANNHWLCNESLRLIPASDFLPSMLTSGSICDLPECPCFHLKYMDTESTEPRGCHHLYVPDI